MAFTKSWFVAHPVRRNGSAALHPAKFPESLVYDFLKFFTRHQDGHVILDPFCGTGSTLVAVDQANNDFEGNRTGIGIELNPGYAETARELTAQEVAVADATTYDLDQLPDLDFITTSPPTGMFCTKTQGISTGPAGDRGWTRFTPTLIWTWATLKTMTNSLTLRFRP